MYTCHFERPENDQGAHCSPKPWNPCLHGLCVTAATRPLWPLWTTKTSVLAQQVNRRRQSGGMQSHYHGPLARYVKLRVAHASGMPGTFSPPPRDSDPDMHQGTCVTHVPWCMPGSLTSAFLLKSVAGKTFPAFRAHAQPASLRIW